MIIYFFVFLKIIIIIIIKLIISNIFRLSWCIDIKNKFLKIKNILF
jgi:hypothetical protein